MSDFFEPPPGPPPEPERRRYRRPPWTAPPEGTLPGVVALERVLARTEKVAVAITRVAAFPTGIEFELVTMWGGEEEPDLDPFMFRPHRLGAGSGVGPVPPDILRFGVQFADGSKATNTSGMPFGGRPEGPILHAGGGGGGGGSWHQTYWVWPLPPAGTVTLVCEWPAMDIPLTRTEMEAAPILDAAARAQVVFSQDDLPEPPDDGECGVVFIR